MRLKYSGDMLYRTPIVKPIPFDEVSSFITLAEGARTTFRFADNTLLLVQRRSEREVRSGSAFGIELVSHCIQTNGLDEEAAQKTEAVLFYRWERGTSQSFNLQYPIRLGWCTQK